MAMMRDDILRFEYRIGCSATAVHGLLVDQRKKLVEAHHPAQDNPVWEIVMAEVLNNISEHAYGNDDKGEIRLCLSFHPEQLFAVICDDGLAMPDGCLPRGDSPSLDGETLDLPEGGFGWNLVHRLTDTLHYERANGQNTLRIGLRFDPS
ncbi:ATP-binding protein [Cognatishimia sp. F0-27]|uniref:ATP-binding protein n=1 Tax=Cognatishimia sp. F0-27 TaxID=2816855 RepID=UPI001D0C7C9E|nr:ATP-binding protein [Cognatishimia sp. F0-27]MCC1492109.1 ATP-binding protein [Cognatishimia sp. F0-27]